MPLNKLNGHAVNGQLIFFSDEKNFSKDQKTNRKNKQWCSDISEFPIVMATKFLATVVVLGFISNERDGLWCVPLFLSQGAENQCQRMCEGVARCGETMESMEWGLGATTSSSRMVPLPTAPR